MASGRPTPPPPSRPGRSDPWRHERMVQRVPAHLGEMPNDALPPWIVIAGIVLLVVVVSIVAFILLGGPARVGWGGASATSTPTRTPRAVMPIVTTIIATPVPSPTTGPTPVTIKYRVKSGDVLSELAARYKISVQAIKDANNLRDDTIRAGEDLIIPLPTPTPPPTPRSPAGTPTPLVNQSPSTPAAIGGPAGVIRHIVQRGDNLYTLAAHYGSSVDAIRAANQLESDFLSIGQALLVPVGAWSPTPSPTPLVSASATPPAQFAYSAPTLLWPPDSHAFRGGKDLPTLSWESPGTLKPNEVYVLHIDYVWKGENKSIIRQIKQGTSVKLDAADYPGENANGTIFSWYVLVVNQATNTRAPSSPAAISAVSPPSATRAFVWY